MFTDTAHSKVTSSHLSRTALLYVRQSTLKQVLHNTESAVRQYDLRGRAIALGWNSDQITVIDIDQGQSGASAADREGFQQLVAEVSLGRAGIVLGLECSRLARNSADWHQLLELCGITATLICDEDGPKNAAQLRRLLSQHLGVDLGTRDGEYPIIREADQPVVRQTRTAPFGPLIGSRRGSARPLGEVLIQDRQRHVAQQRGKNRPLRSSGVGVFHSAILGEDTRLQERLHQRQDAFVSDSCPHPAHKCRMRDLVETGFDIALHHPLVRVGGKVAHLGHRVMRSAIRAEPVGTREKIRLEDRLQHQLQGRLDHPIRHGRDPQTTRLAAWLGDHPLPHRQRAEAAVLQRGPQPVEEHLNPLPGLNGVGRLAIHPGRARPLVPPHPNPRHHQERGIADEVVERDRSSNLR